jgi:kinesin family protein 2/24
MGLVSTWLNGIGLGYAFPAFRAAGIVTPAALAELDLAHYEALGISDAGDRRKLFYLVQRIKMAQPDSGQEEIHDIVTQALSSNQILTQDDSLDEDEEEEEEVDDTEVIVVEQPKVSSNRKSTTNNRTTTQKTGTKQVSVASRTIDSKETKTTKQSNEASKTVPRTRNRVTPAPATRTKKSSKIQEELLKESFQDETKSDSDWESDIMVADDEASQSGRRMSRRLQDKKLKSKSVVSSSISLAGEDDDDETGDSSVQQERKARKCVPSSGKSTLLGYRGDAETSSKKRHTSSRLMGSSTSDLDADDESSIAAAPTRQSGVQAPRARRYESSKLQNPTTRTGKQLSSIPSDSVAPMSPLLKVSLSRLEADIGGQQKMDRKKKMDAVSSIRQLTRSLPQGDVTSSEDTDLEAGKSRKRASSLSGSDTEANNNRRSGRRIPSITSGSDSEVQNVRRRSRLSAGRVSSDSDTEGQSGRRRNRISTGGIQVRSKITKAPRKSAIDLEPAKFKGAVFVHGTAEDTSWYGQVSRLREDNQAEHELFHTHTLDEDDDEMRIRVVVRKRPMSNAESTASKEVDVIHPLDYDDYGRVLVYQAKTRVDLTRQIETVPFAYDNVFDESSCNKDIYERTVRNLIPGVFDGGQWASVFAYGQTGSGKTFTMMGCNVTGINAGTSKDDTANYGLYYMAALDVFALANMEEFRDMSIGVSLFEIYGGKLFDLLNNRQQVKCLEDHRGKVCFPGLSEHPVSDADEVMRVIENGACNRSTGTTSKNADSSRSHAILQIHVRKTGGRRGNVEHGRLTFIDLAGSERGADTSKASRATRLEGAEINTSLLALKEVIRALATGDSLAHIPFRGSKLTQVLKESFVGENSRMVMVACIAPNMSNCEHTLNTLRYADRVKERNSTTGALSASMSDNRICSSKRASRQSISRGTEKPSLPEEDEQCVDDDNEEDDGIEETPSDVQPTILSLEISADDLDLDELLGNSTPVSIRAPGTNKTKPSSYGRRSAEQGTSANALISAHRTVMADMLAMCKDEMTLANKADADRDNVDSYLEKLENIHEKQCEMLTTLHEKLLEYRGSRGPANEGNVLVLSDDDSFEDLRD